MPCQGARPKVAATTTAHNWRHFHRAHQTKRRSWRRSWRRCSPIVRLFALFALWVGSVSIYRQVAILMSCIHSTPPPPAPPVPSLCLIPVCCMQRTEILRFPPCEKIYVHPPNEASRFALRWWILLYVAVRGLLKQLITFILLSFSSLFHITWSVLDLGTTSELSYLQNVTT